MTEERLDAIEAWIEKQDPEWNTPPSIPVPSPVTKKPYGPGVAIDSKANIPIGEYELAHRFQAVGPSLVAHRWSQRFGPYYSGGNGGVIQMTIETDKAGFPSGSAIGSVRYTPNRTSTAHATSFTEHAFGAAVTLTPGTYYHLVYRNVGTLPQSNFMSVNDVYSYAAHEQPALPEGMYVSMRRPGGSWSIDRRYLPVMDLRYADGRHDGFSYIESMWEKHGLLDVNNQMRERFVPKETRSFSEMYARPRRISSGTGSLILEVWRNNTRIASVADGIEDLPVVSAPSGERSGLEGGRWTGGAVNFSITAGVEHELRLKATGSARLVIHPVRLGHSRGSIQTTEGMLAPGWEDGLGGERLSGSSWVQLYPWSPQDIPFFFR